MTVSPKPERSGGPTQVWLGTAGWSYVPDWNGVFYPEGTSSSQSLHRYVEAFRFVEIDSTFYAAPAQTTLDRWSRVMGDGFRVSCKAPKELVQDTGLRPPEVPFGHFCGSLAETFGDRLAMVVVQLQPSFARTEPNQESLEQFLRRWGNEGVPIGIEFRSESWDDPSVKELLRAFGVTMISNDLHDVPALGPRWFDTNDQVGYLRLIGRHDGLAKDRIQRPQTSAQMWWIQRILAMAERGVRNIYVVANNHYEGHAPATLRTLRYELEQAASPGQAGSVQTSSPSLLVVPSPGFPNGPQQLFG